MQAGPQRFIDEVAELGLRPKVEAELVICVVTPALGARAGTPVEVGVALDELQPWPQAPPYWVQLPSDISFTRTTTDASPKDGWVKHSRQIQGWGHAPAAVHWSSHIQAVLKDAIS